MIFGDTPVEQAEGAILAHSHRLPGRNFAKGRRLSFDDLAVLRQAGVTSVIAARLEAGDVHEDEAARAVAAALCGPGLTAAEPFTGRVNLFAEQAGVVVVDGGRIERINRVHESITVATLARHAPAEPRQMVATIKIIPFAAPRGAVEECIAIAGNQPALTLAAFAPKRIGLIQTAVAGTKVSMLDKTREVTRGRVNGLGGVLVGERRAAHRDAELAAEIEDFKREGLDILLIAGASAIVDRRDVIPAAIERVGGTVDHFGLPVDPGNLMLLGHVDGMQVLGLPGCARSPKFNGFDQVLQRLAADLPVSRDDIAAMGVGGLLAEIVSRPQPRDEPKAMDAVPKAPRVAAIVLAAGRSTRMGERNKLLVDVEGRPMLARSLQAVARSQVAEIVVVLGHQADQVRQVAEQALPGRTLRFVENPNYAQGLSTSLRAGLRAVPGDADAVLVALGDMPAITPAEIDRLIAAFNPVEQRAIVVPTYKGKRGNPILWARRFIPDMMTAAGDVGARHLIGENAELVREVEMAGEGVLVDLDTPEALAGFVGKAT
jgi:molybdenum cofactor cytidylyltransferase